MLSTCKWKPFNHHRSIQESLQASTPKQFQHSCLLLRLHHFPATLIYIRCSSCTWTNPFSTLFPSIHTHAHAHAQNTHVILPRLPRAQPDSSPILPHSYSPIFNPNVPQSRTAASSATTPPKASTRQLAASTSAMPQGERFATSWCLFTESYQVAIASLISVIVFFPLLFACVAMTNQWWEVVKCEEDELLSACSQAGCCLYLWDMCISALRHRPPCMHGGKSILSLR